jgi:hypothetical protein
MSVVATRARVAAAVLGAASTLGVVACEKDFQGPYPCNQGYASCTTSNSCETNLAADPQNCGACNMMCPQGALCVMSACTVPPQTLATGVGVGNLTVNATDVFFTAVSATGVDAVPKGGGTAFPVPTPNSQGGTFAFATDDARLYYFGQNFMGPGGPVIAAVPAGPPDGGTPAPVVVGTFPMMGGFGISWMTVLRGTLFLAGNANGGFAIDSVPTSGGMVMPVVTFPGNPQAQAIDATNVYALVNSGGPCELDSAPTAGGKPSTLVGSNAFNNLGGGCPQSIASDGTNVYWASNFTESVGNNNNGGNFSQECLVQVGSASVGGGAPATPTTVGSVRADEAPLRLATDGTNVYVVTNASLWKFPTGGQTGLRIAGNLGINMGCGGGGPSFNGGCSHNGNCGPMPMVELTLDDTSAYVAIATTAGGTQGGVLLKVPK